MTETIIEKEAMQDLPVKLTDKEKAVLADRITSLELEVAALEVRRKRVAKEFKEQIQPLEEEILEKAQSHQDGAEVSPVRVVHQFNYEHGKVITIRMDTDQVVTERSMTSEEMQRDMLPDEPVAEVEDADKGDPPIPEAPGASEVPAE